MYLVEREVNNFRSEELYGIATPAAYFVFVEQVWPGSRIHCRALPKVDWVGCQAFTGKQEPGRHCCQLRQFKMVHTGKGKLGHTSTEGLRSEKADGTCKKQRRPTGGTTFQPFCGGFSTGNYSILFYVLDSWQAIEPTKFEARREHIAWRPSARFP